MTDRLAKVMEMYIRTTAKLNETGSVLSRLTKLAVVDENIEYLIKEIHFVLSGHYKTRKS